MTENNGGIIWFGLPSREELVLSLVGLYRVITFNKDWSEVT